MTRRFFFLVLLGTLGCQAADTGSAARAGTPAAGFARKPEAAREDGKTRITFEAAAPTDYAVWVLDGKGGKVRHLAAGALGEGGKIIGDLPLLKRSFVWDGKDDRGRPVPAGTYTVRVGLGTEARFERVIGHQPQWLGNIYAMAVGPKGNLYAYCSRGICVLDRQGKYVRQIAPAPAGTPVENLAGLKPVELADGTVYLQQPYQFPGRFVGQMAITATGQILLPGPGRYARNLTRINIDGSVPADAFETKLTMLSDIGFLYVAASPDGKTAYISGAEAGYKGDDARKVVYRQSVYRLRLDGKGPAEIFTGDDENRGGPGFSVSKPKGLATDSRGRLYVCNHRGDNVAVYSPNGGLVKSFKVPRPQLVAVHPVTGQVYVLAGAEKGYTKYGYDYPATMTEAKLLRLSAAGEVEAEKELPHAWVRNKKSRPGPCYKLSMAVDFTGKKPVVWLGVAYPGAQWSKWNLFRLEDEGEGFSEPREVCPKPAGALMGTPLQVMLDARNDIVYYNAGGALGRFTGDGEPLPGLKLRHPKTGKKYGICEAALDPDGNICMLTWLAWGYRNNRVVRFDPEGKWLPFPRMEVEGVPVTHAMKGGGGGTTRGFTVAPNGEMYVMYFDDKYPGRGKLVPWDRAFGLRVAVAKISADGEVENPRLIAHLRAGANGVRVDRGGNVYVADNIMPPGVTFPRDFAGALPDPLKRPYPARLEGGSFDPLLRNMGSVFKFGPEGGKIAGLTPGSKAKAPQRPAGDLWKPAPKVQWILHNSNRLAVEGAEWQFHGISPIPAQYQGVTHVERCVCRGGRFDLDEFGRVFVPDALRHRVTVLDSEGNVITRFGFRANQDYAGPGIGLVEPKWVAAASDRAYIGELGAWRIVKVRLRPKATATCEVEIK